MRDPRDCFLLGVCWKRRFTRENARSSSETNSKRTLLEQSEGAVFENAFAHTLALLRVREVTRVSTLRRILRAERFRSFKRFSLGCSSGLKRRSKVTSVYHRKTSSNASTSSGFHGERERPNPSLVASHREYHHRALFLNKNTV